MTKGPEITLQPEVLKWARISAGLSVEDAAKTLRLSVERLHELETKGTAVSYAKFRDIAKAYKRPSAILLKKIPPKEISIPTDFRTAQGIHPSLSKTSYLEFRKARNRRKLIIETSELLGEKVSAFNLNANLNEDPEQVGARIRTYLLSDKQAFTKLADPDEAFRFWRDRLEEIGVLIFQIQRVSSEDFRASSLYYDILPIVLVNNQDFPRGKVFSLFHELTHLLIRRGGFCDLSRPKKVKSEVDKIEVFCNAVAGATLVPKDELITAAGFIDLRTQREWSKAELKNLSEFFKVSQEVVFRRLLDLGFAKSEQYEELRAEWISAWKKYRAKLAQNKGGPHPADLALPYVGKRVASLVLKGVETQTISPIDFTNILGVKFQHITKIQRALAEGDL